MKKIFYLFICTALFVSCSGDKEEATITDAKSVIVATDRVNSEVPRDRLIYNTLRKADSFTLDELIALYNKDVSDAEPDYVTNLKNMWLTILKHRVYDGTEEQKLFYINESVNLENNLAHFTDFYNVLAESRLLSRAEKEAIANTYHDKNIDAINDIQWRNPEDKKKKEGDLIYAKRIFTIFAKAKK